MFEPIKDRAIAYPFLPNLATEVRELAATVRDLRILITKEQWAFNKTLVLTTIQENLAIFAIAVVGNDGTPDLQAATTIEVPITSGVDTIPTGESYMLVDSAFSAIAASTTSAALETLRVCPDCFMFTETAPRISMVARTHLTTSDTATCSIKQLGSTIKLQNGYNIAVSGDGTHIRWTAQEGGGIGRIPAGSDVFDNITSMPYVQERGLRSINGLTGNVSITGYSTLSITNGNHFTLVISDSNAAQPPSQVQAGGAS